MQEYRLRPRCPGKSLTADIIDWSDRGRRRRLVQGLAHAKALADEIEQLLSGGKGPELLRVLGEIETLNSLLIGLEHLLPDEDSKRVLRTTREALDAVVARARKILDNRHAEAGR